jgi:cysteinyl-tRNA synthetase
MDFVLWKPSSEEEPGWESPWGRGRPGWHIECSAMSLELLGESFDIHGGGLDLQFPHHENEIAQSACAHPHGTFARYWLHNEMLQVEGKKMSKSLGNFFTVRDLLDQGVPGEVIRFVFLMTHYRKPMDWTAEKAREARATLEKWAIFARGIPASTPSSEVLEALSDDLNTHAAVTELHRIFNSGDAGKLRASAQLLGLMQDVHEGWLKPPGFDDIRRELLSLVSPLLSRIEKARADRNFEVADDLRANLAQAGVNVMITKSGVEWPFTLQDAARLRDQDAPNDGFLGVSEYVAAWMREKLVALQ